MNLSANRRLLYTDGVDSVVDEQVSPSRWSEGPSVQVVRSQPPIASAELDPALLAFVKCHITSFVKWDVLRALAEQTGSWTDSSALAREMARPAPKIEEALAELSAEGLVNARGPVDARVYQLDEHEPTTVVLKRLIARVTRSQELRRIVVAHILQGAVA
jgi:hypothetical protein